MTLIKTRLALRSAALILLILALVGALFLGVGRSLVAENEQRRQQALLEGLLNTVDNTIRIALFLGDEQLANEVATGLVQNVTVQAVTIIGKDKAVLAHQSRIDIPREVSDNAQPLVRQVNSPFQAEEVIGSIELFPNQQAIADEVNSSSRFITLFFFALLATVALSIVLVVILLITRPIAQISRRLHGLKVETGEHLELPRGNEKDEIGTLVGDVNAMIDHLVNILSNERHLRIEREQEEKKFRAIVDNAETGIFMLDAAGTIMSSNPAFRRLFSATLGDIEHRRLRFGEILGESGDAVDDVIHRSLASKEVQRVDVKLEGAGGTRWLNVILNPIENDQLQGVANDITERKQAQVTAEKQAVTDALTGINNRLGFEHKLQWVLETRQRYPEQNFALLMMDLDLFKEVNDTLGHLAGDQVLIAVAARIQAVLRKSDFVARLGGDEFAVIVDSDDQREFLTGIAGKIIDAINEPIPLEDGQSAQVGVSIGITSPKALDITVSELLRNADQAMYHSKHAGRNTYHFFDPAEN